MSSSPYTPENVKEYIKQHNIESLVNTTVNTLLRSQPQDPYGFIIGLLQARASSDIKVIGIKAYETITAQALPAMKMFARVQYLNKQMGVMIHEPFGILSDEGMILDGSEKFGGKGISKGITFFNEVLSGKVEGYNCAEQSDIDKQLENAYKENNNLGLYQINSLSFVIPRIQSQVLSTPLYQIISQLADSDASKEPRVSFMVNCLHGGKAIASKCKIFKYMIITKPQGQGDPFLAASVLQSVRKAIVAGKAGQAGLKLSSDGTFVCPVDTIMDNLKIVQESINGVAGAKQMFSIGLSWAADTLYSADTKKYELENPKTPFDNDQMIDYLVKLVNDKPIIKYLEDPLAASQKMAWKKLRTKLDEAQTTKNVKLGSRNRNLFTVNPSNEPISSLKASIEEVCVPVTSESHPDLSAQEQEEANAQKFCLDFFQLRLFEVQTLSSVISLRNMLGKVNTRLILQDNLYETADTSIVDICVGLGAVMNLGSINGYKIDRISKLNRINELRTIRQLLQDQ